MRKKLYIIVYPFFLLLALHSVAQNPYKGEVSVVIAPSIILG